MTFGQVTALQRKANPSPSDKKRAQKAERGSAADLRALSQMGT